MLKLKIGQKVFINHNYWDSCPAIGYFLVEKKRKKYDEDTGKPYFEFKVSNYWFDARNNRTKENELVYVESFKGEKINLNYI